MLAKTPKALTSFVDQVSHKLKKEKAMLVLLESLLPQSMKGFIQAGWVILLVPCESDGSPLAYK